MHFKLYKVMPTIFICFLLLLKSSTDAFNYANIIPGIPSFNLNLFGSIFDLFSDILGINALTSSWILESMNSHLSLVAKKLPLKSYDFIVIGAGSAGSVVASRLSENPKFRVLLVEAGGPENLVTDTPGLYEQLRGTRYDWAYVTEPQIDSAFNFDGQRVLWPRGRGLGGSSAINAMLYTRGAIKGYDDWAARGLPGWSYQDVLPYFLLSEGNTDPLLLATNMHNGSGPLIVTSHMLLSENPFGPLLVRGCNELGFPVIDINGHADIGTNLAQQTLAFGSRMSASKAFLEPIINKRKNLDILDNALVTKILFSKDKKAMGVVINRYGYIMTVTAKKEIIVSAGAIGSPHLLLVSGVGPKAQLKKFGIPVVVDLPGVGENLQDHVYVIGPSFTLPSTGPPLESIAAFNDFIAKRVGPMAFLDQSLCVANSSLNQDFNWGDIQVNAVGPFNTNPQIVNLELGLKLSVFNKMYAPYIGRSAFTLRAALMRPKSRGRLVLQSSDPAVPPLLQPKYYSHPDDIRVVIEGLRWNFRLAQTKAFKIMKAEMFKPLVVGCEHHYRLTADNLFRDFLLPTDQYLECVARYMNINGYHQAGTCKMGVKSDPMAVVDNQLRVFGVSGLRVIDASIMPVLVNENTNAPCIMIGERGVQFIIDKYRYNRF